ncbi:hypothetical protein HDA31_002103 [Micromonospora carbonacea subsp. aurantiaca]|nr:hypothetical protein [Micromonospora carbonacea]
MFTANRKGRGVVTFTFVSVYSVRGVVNELVASG